MPSPAGLISSPYDTDARYSTKREVEWVGYKAHLTETCDEDRPHLIVNVETTPATTPDDNMIERSMSRRRGATCCRASTWSTRATPIPRSSSPASASTA